MEASHVFDPPLITVEMAISQRQQVLEGRTLLNIEGPLIWPEGPISEIKCATHVLDKKGRPSPIELFVMVAVLLAELSRAEIGARPNSNRRANFKGKSQKNVKVRGFTLARIVRNAKPGEIVEMRGGESDTTAEATGKKRGRSKHHARSKIMELANKWASRNLPQAQAEAYLKNLLALMEAVDVIFSEIDEAKELVRQAKPRKRSPAH